MSRRRSRGWLRHSFLAVLLLATLGACSDDGDDDSEAATRTTAAREDSETSGPVAAGDRAAFCETMVELGGTPADAPALWQQAVEQAPADIDDAIAEMVELMKRAVEVRAEDEDAVLSAEETLTMDRRMDEVFSYVGEHCPDAPIG